MSETSDKTETEIDKNEALQKAIELAPHHPTIAATIQQVNQALDLKLTSAAWRGLLNRNPIEHEKIKLALGTAKSETPSTITIDGDVVGAVINDVHVPYHDRDAIKLACKVLEWWKPNVLVLNGDLLDCYGLSKYDKNPSRIYRLQDEIDLFHTEVVAPVRHAVGKQCREIYLLGNHDARLIKYLWSHPELFSLRDLSIQSLLKLDKYNIEFAEYSVEFGNLLEVSHGTRVNKWAGMSAKAEQELRRYSISTITGHVHRSGTFKTKVGDRWSIGQESPCLCSLNPEYMRVADWVQGLTLFTITNGVLTIHPVEFKQGSTHIMKKVFSVT